MSDYYPELCDEVMIVVGDFAHERGVVMDWRPGRLADIGVVVNQIMRWYQLSEIAPAKPVQTPQIAQTVDDTQTSAKIAQNAPQSEIKPFYALPTLPPANRCLPAPKAKTLRLPLTTPDVIYLPASSRMLSLPAGYFWFGYGSQAAAERAQRHNRLAIIYVPAECDNVYFVGVPQRIDAAA